jgi:hypothetical protein
MARLPEPQGDEGTWGDILNEYLEVSHTTTGTIKTDAVPANALQDGSVSEEKLSDGSVTDAKLSTTNGPTNGLVLGYSGGNMAWVNGGSGGDPTMGGDLSGIASNAQIIAGAVGATELATNAVTTIKITDSNVTTAKIADANVTDAKIASGVSQSKVTNLVSDLAGKEPTLAAGTTAQYYRGDKSWQTLDKTAVGLANVDNTSDANKPVSSATQTALNAKANTTTTITAGTGLTGGGDLSANRTISASFGTTSGTIAQGNDSRITGAEQTANKAAPSGYASLDSFAKVPIAQLPTGTSSTSVAIGNDSRITGAEQTANKGAANGYAGLNSSTQVPAAQLGSGTADGTTYLRGDGTWAATPTAPVTSVASKTGAVTLVEGDIANLTTDLAARVTVANGGGETYFDAGNSGSAKTIDLANGNVQKLTLTAGCTITLTAPATGAYRSIMLYVFQDGTGSRTITWPGSVSWGTAGAPTLSTAASKMDKILLDTVDGGTTWYGTAGPGGF